MITNFAKTGLLIFTLFVLLTADFAMAGFGVTPPFVRNVSLTRNSTFEQKILLVQGDPNVDLKATITVDAPEIRDWIEVLEGEAFILPRGEQKVPMTVRITVPSDADFKAYTGAIRIKTGFANDAVGSGAVNISLGAQIDIELQVIDKVIEDFRIRKIGISDLNEGTKIGWLYFPGKIPFSMLVENTGNVNIAPSEVIFKIYDASGTVLLEETSNLGGLPKIEPFATEDMTAYIPTRLPSGAYLVRFIIKNGDAIKHEGELSLNILPYGTLQTAGFGFLGLSVAHKVSVLLPLLAFLVLILLVAQTYRQRRRISK